MAQCLPWSSAFNRTPGEQVWLYDTRTRGDTAKLQGSDSRTGSPLLADFRTALSVLCSGRAWAVHGQSGACSRSQSSHHLRLLVSVCCVLNRLEVERRQQVRSRVPPAQAKSRRRSGHTCQTALNNPWRDRRLAAPAGWRLAARLRRAEQGCARLELHPRRRVRRVRRRAGCHQPGQRPGPAPLRLHRRLHLGRADAGPACLWHALRVVLLRAPAPLWARVGRH